MCAWQVAVMALGLLAGCGGQAAADDCQQAQARYLDLLLQADEELRQLPPPQSQAARSMLHAVKLGQPAYEKLQLRCTQEVSLAATQCARKAEGVEQWEACLQ